MTGTTSTTTPLPAYSERVGAPACGVLFVCDHASNAVPPDLGSLGLPEGEFARHIAWDIGAGALTAALADRFAAPAVLAGFSRLVIDPNRGEDDPTLIMQLSDGAVIPGNRHLDAAARQARLDRFYRPYHAAIAAALDRIETMRAPALIVSIHSFTPVWRGRKRRMEYGILWNTDGRLAEPLIARLRAVPELTVGDNEPYKGALAGDCMDRHGTHPGRPHVLIEIRQDLIETADGVTATADTLEPAIRAAITDAGFAGHLASHA